MIYKVTARLAPSEPKPVEKKEPRKRRKSAVFDSEGNEVLITMTCLKCRAMKPLSMFGLRKMADGAIRNQPWCRTCRSGASAKKPKSSDTTVPAPGPTDISTESTEPEAEAPGATAADVHTQD